MASKKLTGQFAIADGTTPTAGPIVSNNNRGFYVSFPTTNTATSAYMGDNNDAASSDVATTDLFIMEEGTEYFISPNFVDNLSDLWFVSSTTDVATFCYRVA